MDAIDLIQPMFRVGDIEITRVIEIYAPFRTPADTFPLDAEAAAEAALARKEELEPWAIHPRSGMLILGIQTYILKTGSTTILVDTCVGCDKTYTHIPAWHMRKDASWLGRLSEAGFPPESIDYVLCTHLHGDHVGWNTRLLDGRWVPTFPNATYLMTAVDEAFQREAKAPLYTESVLPVIEANQAKLVGVDHAFSDEIWLEPTPGHTPGHVAVRLRSNGQEATLTGDVIHSTLQCAHPEWRFFSDIDPEQAAKTRRAVLEAHCETDRLFLPAHFPLPTIGHVVRDGDAFGYRFREG